MITIALERVLQWRPSLQVSRALIVAAVVFASAYLGRSNSGSQAQQVSLALLAGAIVVLRWPALGLIGVLLAAISAPFDIPTGTLTTIPVSMLLVGVLSVIWFVGMVARRRFTWISSAANLPLACFLVAATLS